MTTFFFFDNFNIFTPIAIFFITQLSQTDKNTFRFP